MSQYPTNLTDKQWQVTEIILDPQHRKRKYSLRDIMDAIMYIVKTGCQWRMLPRDFPPFNTVFYYFNKWKEVSSPPITLLPTVALTATRRSKGARNTLLLIHLASLWVSWFMRLTGKYGQDTQGTVVRQTADKFSV